MTPEADIQLLREFAEKGAESAFSGLVARHINLVYSVALRQVGDPHHAKEVTQAVFIILSRKAVQLRHERALSSWLFQTTRLTANNFIRSEIRRQKREQEAYMQSTLNEPAGEAWPHIAPMLDTAVGALGETDRRAILLRFYEGNTLPAVGAALGISEAAAEKRVSRALEKLRKYFGKRGIVFSGGAIAAAVSANAVQAAPAGLAAAITAATLSGTTITTAAILAATKGSTMTALQYITVTTALTATIGAGIYEAKQAGNARAEVQAMREQQASMVEQIQQLQSERDMATNRLTAMRARPAPGSGVDESELLRLRGEVGVLKGQAADAEQKAQAAEATLAAYRSATAKFEGNSAATVNAAKMTGLAIRMFSNDNGGQYPTNLIQLAEYFGNATNTWTIGGISLFGFDFVNAGAVNDSHPNMVVLRERMARQEPNGTWQRIYGLADGSVQTATTFDGNFEGWEKANTELPAVAEKQ